MSTHPLAAVLHREWAADLTPARLYSLLRLRVAGAAVRVEVRQAEE
jgi:hypothetical protein